MMLAITNTVSQRAIRLRLLVLATLAAVVSMAWHGSTAQAESDSNFYRGKKVSLIIGYRPGGSYGTYGRLFARHLGKHIPGDPTLVPQNMPGAGSLVASNYLYNVAPKDGSVLGVIGQSVYLMQQLKRPKINFDARKFNWIGRFSDVTVLVIAWHESKVKTIQDAMKTSIPVAVGGTLSGSTLYIAFMNELAGTRFQPIKGYSSASAFLAMERGEVDATSSVSITSLASRAPTWVKEGKINILVQVGMEPSHKFPKVPGVMSLVSNKRDRAMLEAIVGPNTVGRSVMAPPGLPAARVALLRTAFDRVVADKDFLSEAKKLRLSVRPLSGEKLQAFFTESANLDPDLVARMNRIIKAKHRSCREFSKDPDKLCRKKKKKKMKK